MYMLVGNLVVVAKSVLDLGKKVSMCERRKCFLLLRNRDDDDDDDGSSSSDAIVAKLPPNFSH